MGDEQRLIVGHDPGVIGRMLEMPLSPEAIEELARLVDGPTVLGRIARGEGCRADLLAVETLVGGKADE